jgi:hypothetical protein
VDGTLTSIEDAVWDATTANHADAGSLGKGVADAQSAGDPWATTITGSETAGTTGYAIMKMNRVFQ